MNDHKATQERPKEMITKLLSGSILLGILIGLVSGCSVQNGPCQIDSDCPNDMGCFVGICAVRKTCAKGKLCGSTQQQTSTCKPGEKKCDGNTLKICGNFGKNWASMDCGGFHTCQAGRCVRKSTTTSCGNGTVEGTEQCDDGNQLSGDGCSMYCFNEKIERMEAPASVRIPETFVLGSKVCANANTRKETNKNKAQLYVLVSPVVCRNNGTPVVSASKIKSHIAYLNQVYKPAKLAFILGKTRWEDSAKRCEVFYAGGTSSIQRYTISNGISMFYANNIRGGNFSIAGFANLSGVVLSSHTYKIEQTIAHELGHSFGLDHPHACYHGRENRSNCENAGDQLCDTPPDPGPQGVNGLDVCPDRRTKNGTCKVVNCKLIGCAGGEKPLIDNLMSYYHCGNTMTPDQIATVRCVAFNNQSNRVTTRRPCQTKQECGGQECTAGYCQAGGSQPQGCTRNEQCGGDKQRCHQGQCVACIQNYVAAGTDGLCCSNERNSQGSCCQGASCCGKQNHSILDSNNQCRCESGYTWNKPEAAYDFQCKAPNAPTCKQDGSWSSIDSQCCSQQRDDQGKCCKGNACCTGKNHSYTASDGKCACQHGYEWETPGSSDDRRCKLIPAPSCKKDGEHSSSNQACCSQERTNTGICCTGNACCGKQNNSSIDSTGTCLCISGYERTSPNDPKDMRCQKKITTPTNSICTLRTTLSGHNGQLSSISISPNGATVVTASHDKTIKVWNAQSGQLSKTISGHKQTVTKLLFLPNNQSFTAGDEEGYYKKWSLNTSYPSETFKFIGKIKVAGLSPNGQYSVIGTEQGIYSWYFNGSSRKWSMLNFQASSLAMGPQSKYLALGGDKKIQIHEFPSLKLVKTFRGHTGMITGIDASKNSKMLATISKNLKLWDITTGKLSRTITAQTGRFLDVKFHPKRRLVVTAGEDKTIKIWDRENGTLLQTLSGHTDQVTSLTFSADGKTLVSASADQTARVWSCQ